MTLPNLARSWSDRITDAVARRPGGWFGRWIYRHPYGHHAGFDRVLAECPLTAQAKVLEVGCGGGVFLRRVLASGCQAVAVDHSPDMVMATRQLNDDALSAGRLTVIQGDAGALPLPDGGFSHVFCLNAFFFFPDPERALAEMARCLAPGGQLVIITAPPEARQHLGRLFGPIAQRMRFDAPAQLTHWAQSHGLICRAVHRLDRHGYLFLAERPALAAGAVIDWPGAQGRVVAVLDGIGVCDLHLKGDIADHANPHDELLAVLSGRVCICDADGERWLDSGDIIVAPAGRSHAARAPDGARVLVVGRIN